MRLTWWQRLPLFMPDDGAASGAQQGQQGQQGAQGAQQGAQQGQQQGAQQDGLGHAAAAAAAAAAAQQGQQQGAQGQQGTDPNAGKFILKNRPEWLGETFWNKDTGEVNVEGIARNAADLKAKLSTGTHKPPADANGYTIDFSKETDPDIKTAAAALILPGEDGSPDPVLAAVQADCFKEGISTHAFNTVVRSYLKHMAGALPEPFNEKAEMAKLGQNGPALLKGLNDYAQDQVNRGFWDDADMQRWKNWNYDAGDAQLLYKILFDSGRVPEIKVQAMQTAAATPDASQLDQELNSIQTKLAKGEINSQQADALFAENLAKREKLYGKDPTRSFGGQAA